jgi:hypothetical protein
VFPSAPSSGRPYDPDAYAVGQYVGPVDPRVIEEHIASLQAGLAELRRVRAEGLRANQRAIPELKSLIVQHRRELKDGKAEGATALKRLQELWDDPASVSSPEENSCWHALRQARMKVQGMTENVRVDERELAACEERLPVFELPSPREIEIEEALPLWRARLQEEQKRFTPSGQEPRRRRLFQ